MPSRLEKVVTVTNPMGIHMRPADLLVRTASRFECRIELEKDGQIVDGRSILGILTLGATQGCEIRLVADGPDAGLALAALAELFSQGFHEFSAEIASPGNGPH
ncbi:MAG: HPr family phosphocarrier protein [Planctomycetales bacterium]|nr:HPr family phosphocarrier protein [Planctomycetales bacterium]